MINKNRVLSPKILQRLSNLALKARFAVEGVLTGIHKSPQRGSSIEFSEYKEYSRGDEIRHIDWKTYARSDKYYVKQFEQETNLKCYILLDSSASMLYKSKELTKLDYASKIAIGLSYILLNQKDQVGLLIFGKEIVKYIPPRSQSTHLQVITSALESIKGEGETNISYVLESFAEKIKGRSMIILISDLFDKPEDVISSLKHFRHRKHEVIIFHILDPYELTFPFEDITLFEDMEKDRKILASPRAIKEKYLEELNFFIERYRKKCLEDKIDYFLVDTSTPIEQALGNYLAKRELQRF